MFDFGVKTGDQYPVGAKSGLTARELPDSFELIKGNLDFPRTPDVLKPIFVKPPDLMNSRRKEI
jgi:hypothetical protein